MKTFGFSLLVLGLVLAALPASAQGATTITLHGDASDGDYAWFDANGAKNPTISVAPGQTITVNLESKNGFHAFEVNGQKSEDFDTGATTTFTFTAPASGSTTYVCPYHPNMKGTMNFGAASTTPTADEKNDSPGIQVFGVALAFLGAALLLRRK